MKLIALILGVVPNKQLSIFFTNPKKLNKTDNDFAIYSVKIYFMHHVSRLPINLAEELFSHVYVLFACVFFFYLRYSLLLSSKQFLTFVTQFKY